MSFIGVVIENKNEASITKLIDGRLKEQKKTTIMINHNSIPNIKNIKFETILVIGNLAKFEKENQIKDLKEILNNTKKLIINTDVEENLKYIKELTSSVITYGFNSKATVTASSVEEDTLQLCIQRKIEGRQGNVIEPQEISVQLEELFHNNNSSICMGIFTLLMLYQVLI